MKIVVEWDEFPDGPYVNTEYKCVCGDTAIANDDYRLRINNNIRPKRIYKGEDP